MWAALAMGFADSLASGCVGHFIAQYVLLLLVLVVHSCLWLCTVYTDILHTTTSYMYYSRGSVVVHM